MSDNLVKIASYNIHSCIGNDNINHPARIAKVINELDADIIALQEVRSDLGSKADPFSNQPEFLALETGLKAISGPTILKSDSTYGNVILTHLNVLDVRLHDISFHEREPRGVIDLDIEINNQVIQFVATHFGLSFSERSYQANYLLTALLKRKEIPKIIVGDFNNWLPFSYPVRLFNNFFKPHSIGASFPSQFSLFRLDKIWTGGAISLVEHEIVKNPLTRMASDHLPVLATIKIN